LAEQLTAALVVTGQAPTEASDPRLDEALAALPDDDRAIVTLAAWEQLTPAEIAVALGMHPGTVRTRLHRARGRLRATLDAPEPRPRTAVRG
jgi:RNA polymerase sigma-70 factor (ECF subfamily)